MNSCVTCSYFRPAFGGRCHRDMRLQSGQVIKQHTSGRPTDVERDEKSQTWKYVKRDMADVCGKVGKHWVAK